MPVTQEQVDALSRIYGFLESEVKKEGSDAYGVYEKIVRPLKWDKYRIKPDDEEKALRQFARYCYYDLKATNEEETGRLLNNRLKETAFLDRRRMEDNAREIGVPIRDTSLDNWVKAQRTTASHILFHFRTPIQVEE
jgi:hypothetical protein